jgi:hypothetical protein
MKPGSVFTKIVCGVDGSPAGLDAVEQAQRLAAAGAELTVVSVSESHLAVHTGPLAGESAQRLNEEAQAALDDARKQVGDARRSCCTAGRPTRSSLQSATMAQPRRRRLA